MATDEETLGLTDAELVERVVRSAGAGRGPRWIAVRHKFVVGSTTARVLCRRFGLDPDEEVHRARVQRRRGS